MTREISEARFEQDIEASLLRGGPDTDPATVGRLAERPTDAYGAGHPGGYHRRRPDQYDRSLCLIPDDLIAFVQATQPDSWERLREHHGDGLRDEFVRRISAQVARRGLLTLLWGQRSRHTSTTRQRPDC